MPKARIYQPAKNAMQSGDAKRAWVLEWVPEKPLFTDSLMGWTGMREMAREICLSFKTREEAENYAKKQGLEYKILLPKARKFIPKTYADNFRFDRVKS